MYTRMLRPSFLRPLATTRLATRPYSTTKLADVNPAALTITHTQTPTTLGREEDLVFGRKFTGPIDLSSPRLPR